MTFAGRLGYTHRMSERSSQPQPIDRLMTQEGITNAQLVAASTEQLTFKNVQKARSGKRVTTNIQDKILDAFLTLRPQMKLARRDLFRYDLPQETVDAIGEANALAAKGRINYPQLVDRLLKAGITRYEVEVATHEITYFGTSGEAHPEKGAALSVSAPGVFRTELIRAAIADAQKRAIDYVTFLRRIHEAGVIRYESNLRSREIRYLGAEAGYKEAIPSAAPETVALPEKAPEKKVPSASKTKKRPVRKKAVLSLKARKNAKKSWNRRRR